MGKNKYIYKPKDYEIRCCAVQVKIKALDEIKLTGNWEHDSNPENFDKLVSEEQKQEMMKPNEIAKEFNYVGVIPNVPYLIVLFKDTDQEKAIEYYKKMTEVGYEVKLVKQAVYADTRYLEGAFKGKLATLPSDYIDKAIRELFEKYGDELKITDDPVKDLIYYDTDLGGREIEAMVCGDLMLTVGMKNGNAFITYNPTRDYKRVLGDFEKEILKWRAEHPGIAKPVELN